MGRGGPYLVGRQLRCLDGVEAADGGDGVEAGRDLEAHVGQPERVLRAGRWISRHYSGGSVATKGCTRLSVL
jgi:hypothetical protein